PLVERMYEEYEKGEGAGHSGLRSRVANWLLRLALARITPIVDCRLRRRIARRKRGRLERFHEEAQCCVSLGTSTLRTYHRSSGVRQRLVVSQPIAATRVRAWRGHNGSTHYPGRCRDAVRRAHLRRRVWRIERRGLGPHTDAGRDRALASVDEQESDHA